MKTTPTPATAPVHEPVTLEAVEIALRSASDTLFQLAALFNAIKARPEDTSNTTKLAELGAYVAYDIGNMTDCVRADVEAGGIDLQTGSEQA